MAYLKCAQNVFRMHAVTLILKCLGGINLSAGKFPKYVKARWVVKVGQVINFVTHCDPEVADTIVSLDLVGRKGLVDLYIQV